MKPVEGIAALALAGLAVGALALATPEAPVVGALAWLGLIVVLAGVIAVAELMIRDGVRIWRATRRRNGGSHEE